MPTRSVLKNFNLFVDGRGYAGQIEEYTPPVMTLQIEEFRAGGLDTPEPVEMGQEAMQASFAMIAMDANALSVWGLTQGAIIPVTARGALEDADGTVRAIVHRLRGKITELNQGTWTPGTKPQVTITMRVTYFEERVNDEQLREIDTENMVRRIRGVDQLEAQRAALGI